MRKGNAQYKPDDQLDEIRGGSELVNYCRYVLMCGEPKRKSKDDKILITFEVLKMSNAQIPEAKVFEFISKDDFITMNYLGSPDQVLNTEAKIGEAIKNFIIKSELTGEFRTMDVTENADKIGFKRSSLSLGLKWLEDNGIIVREKRGIWRLTSDEEI
jgi:DNA-binding transcriptional ArsR family regulator